MRKQNSTFRTAFLSEAGKELENNDYFAYVELDDYACYVIADGLNEQPDTESARLAIETILLAFEEYPSIKKKAVLSYLKAGNRALLQADERKRLKASVTVIVSDYVKMRYACVGNTRFRLYREGIVREQSADMSLGGNLVKEQKIEQDALAKHEERNNLYMWLGLDKGFRPFVSKKIKLSEGDILTMYTRGIWENLDEGELGDVFSEAKDSPQECLDNIEDMLLSRQPAQLENYTFVSIFIDKIFTDPQRKKRIRKIVTITLILIVVIVVVLFILWLFNRYRIKQREALELRYEDTLEYIQDNNYIRAGEECREALKVAEKLNDKEMVSRISDYKKLIEAVNKADALYDEEKYETAQEDYLTAKERSRHADHAADAYIDGKLAVITDYLSVFDYIKLGDSLVIKGDYKRAEEKYLLAKSLATGIYFTEGRQAAMDALDRLYEELAKEEEETNARMQETVTAETGAAELVSQGDKAFAEGDYEGAKVYYAMALDKYKKLEDAANIELVNTKLKACVKKSTEKEEKKALAEEYEETARSLSEAGNHTEAKKQYILAKEIYDQIQDEEKSNQMDNRMDMLDMDIGGQGQQGENAGREDGGSVSENAVG